MLDPDRPQMTSFPEHCMCCGHSPEHCYKLFLLNNTKVRDFFAIHITQYYSKLNMIMFLLENHGLAA